MPKLSTEQIEQIKKLYSLKTSISGIAKKMNINRATVNYHLGRVDFERKKAISREYQRRKHGWKGHPKYLKVQFHTPNYETGNWFKGGKGGSMYQSYLYKEKKRVTNPDAPIRELFAHKLKK